MTNPPCSREAVETLIGRLREMATEEDSAAGGYNYSAVSKLCRAAIDALSALSGAAPQETPTCKCGWKLPNVPNVYHSPEGCYAVPAPSPAPFTAEQVEDAIKRCRIDCRSWHHVKAEAMLRAYAASLAATPQTPSGALTAASGRGKLGSSQPKAATARCSE
jgi:hypothetical protein